MIVVRISVSLDINRCSLGLYDKGLQAIDQALKIGDHERDVETLVAGLVSFIASQKTPLPFAINVGLWPRRLIGAV